MVPEVHSHTWIMSEWSYEEITINYHYFQEAIAYVSLLLKRYSFFLFSSYLV